MPEEERPLRRKVRARRRKSLVIAAATAIAVLAAVVVLGFVGTRWVESRENLHVYLRGSGVEHLNAGDRIAIDVMEVGQIHAVDRNQGIVTAHLVIKRSRAGEIPNTSVFQVEPLNRWVPGNVGVRIYPSNANGHTEPIRDQMVLQASDRYLPPEIPAGFIYLAAGGLLAMAVAAGVAVAVYRLVSKLATLFVVVIAGLILFLAYWYFSMQITAPDPPDEVSLMGSGVFFGGILTAKSDSEEDSRRRHFAS
jgi:hypothetical protein